MVKKADIILAAAILIVGFALSFLLLSDVQGESVVIESHGEIYGTYSLFEDRSIEVENDDEHNTVSINSGTVSVISTNCLNHDCVNQGTKSQDGETIVCLPHRLVITVKGGENDVDAYTR